MGLDCMLEGSLKRSVGAVLEKLSEGEYAGGDTAESVWDLEFDWEGWTLSSVWSTISTNG